jgi:hypothetical protein
MLKACSGLRGELSRVLADRKAKNDEARGLPTAVGDDDATLASRLFERFEGFFRTRHQIASVGGYSRPSRVRSKVATPSMFFGRSSTSG